MRNQGQCTLQVIENEQVNCVAWTKEPIRTKSLQRNQYEQSRGQRNEIEQSY